MVGVLVAAAVVGPAPTVSAAGVGVDGEGAAAEGWAAGDAQPVRERLERACARIPNLRTRTDNLLARLEGGEGTAGSIAWLEQRVEQAQDRGNADLAQALENRLQVRRESLDVLRRRAERLPELAARCTELGA